jgi:hypothetical protein
MKDRLLEMSRKRLKVGGKKKVEGRLGRKGFQTASFLRAEARNFVE